MSNEGYEDQEHKVLKEPQVSYWAHDPRNLHVDVLVTAHKECFDKVKAIQPNFDIPQEDYATCKYPTLDETGKIILKSPTKFKTDQDKLYADARVAAEAKIEVDKIK
jgi:hypothetical protein